MALAIVRLPSSSQAKISDNLAMTSLALSSTSLAALHIGATEPACVDVALHLHDSSFHLMPDFSPPTLITKTIIATCLSRYIRRLSLQVQVAVATALKPGLVPRTLDPCVSGSGDSPRFLCTFRSSKLTSSSSAAGHGEHYGRQIRVDPL